VKIDLAAISGSESCAESRFAIGARIVLNL
jgi:hypothetical protein